MDEPPVNHSLSVANFNQISKPYEIVGKRYQQIKLVNQTLATANWDENKNISKKAYGASSDINDVIAESMLEFEYRHSFKYCCDQAMVLTFNHGRT